MNRKPLLLIPAIIMIAATSAFAATVTVTSTSNSTIREDNPTANDGSGSTISIGKVDTTPGRVRTLFATSFTTGIPTGSTVNSATFNLTRNGTGLTPNVAGLVTLEIYQLTRAFNETASSWNNYGASTAWTNAGGDFLTLLGTVTADPTVGTGVITFASTPALVAAIQAARDAPANFSMIIKLENTYENVAANRQFFFYSDDAAANLRPNFVIDYTIPEPTSALLAASGIGFFALRRRR